MDEIKLSYKIQEIIDDEYRVNKIGDLIMLLDEYVIPRTIKSNLLKLIDFSIIVKEICNFDLTDEKVLETLLLYINKYKLDITLKKEVNYYE